MKNLKEILENHKIWLEDNHEGERANLSGANLSEAALRRADLRGANLSEANLSEAFLREANLRGADLSEANLREANLREADLREADLSGADLSGADLSEAYLRETNLRGADLSGANLIGAIGDGNRIITIQTPVYHVIWTKEKVWIGCKKFRLKEWEDMDEYLIGELSPKALEFSKEWKGLLLPILKKLQNGQESI